MGALGPGFALHTHVTSRHMVDFKKRLTGQSVPTVVDPVELYETLDRAHDKGPLRPAQQAVLRAWYDTRLEERDNIVKLHTGQGKTLVGLLILQSKLNAGKGPAVYLCPNNYLVSQTCQQAKQFGIATCEAPGELPGEFLDGRAILVTSAQKLFNGLTKFGLGRDSVTAGALLMDDAHACSDKIRAACGVTLQRDDDAYHALVELFARDLEIQGAGTFADIKNKSYDALLPVPYWAWQERESSVAAILSKYRDRNSIKFAWPLLKDMLAHCQCVVSGTAIEIEPYVAPLDVFGTYAGAEHRVFMSATVTDDAFLVKGLQLSPETITNPLTCAEEHWSGEKMVLIPSLVHDGLNRQEVLARVAKPLDKRSSGVVGLASSFKSAGVWGKYGAMVTNKDTVHAAVQALHQGQYKDAVVLVNQYDGIDLPDDSCRALVFDGRPHSQSLIDLHQESCRPSSDHTLMRTLRTVEQGMGRSVRGAKDYSVIMMIGPTLVRLVRDKRSRALASSQMRYQIEIGLEIAQMAAKEIDDDGKEPMDVLTELVLQCLNRNDAWKAFYAQEMDKVRPSGASESILKLYAAEREAEVKYQSGDYGGALAALQSLLDSTELDASDRGWYLQEMARYAYAGDRTESQRLQAAAHRSNHLVLRPAEGFTVQQLTVVSAGRMNRIIEVLKDCGSYEQLNLVVTEALTQLVFGTRADPFEQAFNTLAQLLGIASERPDREWKEGPDNLWAVDDATYLLVECKSEVDVRRAEVNKRETEQMNRSCAWFDKHYPRCKSRNIMVIPTHMVESAGALTHTVEVMRVQELEALVKNARAFFSAFEALDFQDLTPKTVQELVNTHALDTASLMKKYGKAVRHRAGSKT